MDRGAWWTTVQGVAKSWTQLKLLSIKNVLWNLEKFYGCSYLGSRIRGTDAGNKCMDAKGERWGREDLGDGD